MFIGRIVPVNRFLVVLYSLTFLRKDSGSGFMKAGSFFTVRYSVPSRRIYRPLLAFLMLLGFLCGAFFTVDPLPASVSLMRTAASSRVSIVGLMTVLLLPFLISAFAVYTSSPFLLFPVCWLKAFFFSYSAGMISLAFGNAGWLVRWLLLFSSGLSLPLLIWFCMRQGDGTYREDLLRDFTVCAVLILLIGSLDFRVISPFLVKLIE